MFKWCTQLLSTTVFRPWKHRWDKRSEAAAAAYGERGAVPAEDGAVQSRDAVSGPEVQVSSSTAEHFDELAALLQLDGQSQRTLWRTRTANASSATRNEPSKQSEGAAGDFSVSFLRVWVLISSNISHNELPKIDDDDEHFWLNRFYNIKLKNMTK